MQLTLVIPDLIPPQPAAPLVDVYRGLDLARLAFLLARASRRSLPGTSLETWLCRTFRLEVADDCPVAALSLLAEHGNPGEAWWLCADPVHLEPRQDGLMLSGPDLLALSRTEAEQLVNALDNHFAGSAISFHHIRPDRWYLRFATPLSVKTHCLSEAAGRRINNLLPSGRDAARLNRLVNEAQMLLAAHPVNQAREAAGQPTVNGIWPWGGGRLTAVVERPFDHVWADDLLAQGLALASHTACSELPRDGAAVLEAKDKNASHLVVLDQLRAPLTRGDLDAWRRALRQLEEKWFDPLTEAFRRRRLSRLTLLALGPRHNMAFTLQPRARWWFWRRVRPLSHYGDVS